MKSKPSLEESHEIIRRIMKERGATYLSLGRELNFRHEKLATAVKCTTGVTPTTIKMRKSIARALGLDPAEVWSPEYLEYEGRKSYETGPYAVAPASKLSAEVWQKLPPRMRVRALCKDKRIDLAFLQEKYGVTYRVLTTAIYGSNSGDELRRKMAEDLGASPEHIWPDIYGVQTVQEVTEIAPEAGRSNLDAYYGFGCIL